MLPTKFRFIWPSGFGGEDLKKSANQKQELPVVAMFVNRSGQNEKPLERTFHRCFLPSFRRRLKCEKLTDASDGKSSHCLWQGELKTYLNWMKNKNLIYLPNKCEILVYLFEIIFFCNFTSITNKVENFAMMSTS